MAKIMGIVNLHHSVHLDSITERRSLASTAFLGRYCFIDFAISNFTNSGINEIGILIKEHSRSLFRHLGSGDSQWALNTKTGGITLMYNEKYANNDKYNHDVNNLIENKWFLKQSNAEYVVIAPIHMVNIIDYTKAVDEHIKSNADVSSLLFATLPSSLASRNFFAVAGSVFSPPGPSFAKNWRLYSKITS